jgi:predicted DNA-binding transcriptional regulator AlpA
MATENKAKLFITEKELAHITRIALPTLRRWRHERKGPSYIKIGRMVRYDYDVSIGFMDDHKIDLEG